MTNTELETALQNCVRVEREATAEVLRLLREVERRELYLERGCSSLFAYCRKRLGYSEPEAQLRIQAMRLVREVPSALERIESGTLSLSVAALVQSASKGTGLARELVAELSGASKREAESRLAEIFPEQAKPEKTKPISESAVEIRMTVSREEAEMLERLLDRKAHTNFERSKAKLFVELARAALAKLEGKAREANPKAQEYPLQDALPQRPDKVRTRYIPSATRRKIWKRDQGKCQICGTRHALEIDHIKPYCEGGSNEPENLRLLCGAHNRTRK